mmetsp:Transcript_38255/g.73346  ORF Transcript_38255/g.73346 Transcript_38255/m.73346 type:complete len:425 (-) Transcript_38255:207-1481(-)
MKITKLRLKCVWHIGDDDKHGEVTEIHKEVDGNIEASSFFRLYFKAYCPLPKTFLPESSKKIRLSLVPVGEHTLRSTSALNLCFTDVGPALLRQQHPQGPTVAICTQPFSRTKSFSQVEGFTATYVKFWVDYHVLIGFEQIYLYDRWGNALCDELKTYIESGVVVLVPWPFFSQVQVQRKFLKGGSNRNGFRPNTAKTYDHALAHEHCLMHARQLSREQWVLFEDLDEFVRYPDAQPGMLLRWMRRTLTQQAPEARSRARVVEIRLDRLQFRDPAVVNGSLDSASKEQSEKPSASPHPATVLERFVHRSSRPFGGWGGGGYHGKVIVRASLAGVMYIHNGVHGAGSIQISSNPSTQLAIHHYADAINVRSRNTSEADVYDGTLLWAAEPVLARVSAEMSVTTDGTDHDLRQLAREYMWPAHQHQ